MTLRLKTTECHLLYYGITVLPATGHYSENTPPESQPDAGTRFTYPAWMEG